MAMTNGKLVEILSGLEAGSTVYYRYAESLSYDFFSLRK